MYGAGVHARLVARLIGRYMHGGHMHDGQVHDGHRHAVDCTLHTDGR